MESQDIINPELWATLCALDRDLDEMKELVTRNSDRISPCLPGSPPRDEGEEAYEE
ncbi:MAG: hypothetical protein QM820_47170 [Minicystis sp.]